MKLLFNRYLFCPNGEVVDTKKQETLPKKEIYYLRSENGKYKEVRFLKTYYNLFFGQTPKGRTVKVKKDGSLDFDNFVITASKAKGECLEIDEDLVVSKYKNGETIRSIAFYFHTDASIISNLLKRKNIRPSAKNCFRVPYKLNHNFFSNIDSHEKAYLLGILFADGCVRKHSNGINLISNDIDLLLFFKESIGFSGEIKESRFHKKAKHIDFSSIQMKQDLIKLGCVPSKSLSLEFPNIEDKYFWSFLLGYFDGDGSLWVSKDKKQAHFKIISSTSFCLKLQEILQKKGFKSEVRNEPKTHKKETSYVRISNKTTISNIYPLLYKDASFFLKRKNAKFLEIIK